MSQTGTVPMADTAASTSRKPPCITSHLARAVFTAVLKDYQRPEVQEDYRRWKKERTAMAAGGQGDV